jgi:hypothetical protein
VLALTSSFYLQPLLVFNDSRLELCQSALPPRNMPTQEMSPSESERYVSDSESEVEVRKIQFRDLAIAISGKIPGYNHGTYTQSRLNKPRLEISDTWYVWQGKSK